MNILTNQTEFNFAYKANITYQSADLIFFYDNKGNAYLINHQVATIDSLKKLSKLPNITEYLIQLGIEKLICFGAINSQNCFCAMNTVDKLDQSILDYLKPTILKTCYNILSDALFQAAIVGNHITYWLSHNNYCGVCSKKNILVQDDLALKCNNCSELFYPTIAPCIIVLLYNQKNEILLAKHKYSTKNIYTCLAGYVAPGETLEHAVAREVYEEVGLNIDNIKYVASQPWPFPNILMMGFFAQYACGDITIDHIEIDDAKWFHMNNLPELLPSTKTIARYLIERFINWEQAK